MLTRLAVAALAALACSVPSTGQDALRVVREAVLRGDADAARDALRTDRELPASVRALLEAATLGPAPRAEAMLLVARLHRDDPAVCEAALHAGCVALAAAVGRGDGPREVASEPFEGSEDTAPGEPAIGRLHDAYMEELDRLAANGADVAATRASLLRATVSEVAPRLRVASGDTIPVPTPLGEDLEVGWIPSGLDEDPVAALVRAAASTRERLLLRASTYGLRVPAPEPGAYVLEVRDPKTGWRSLRPLLVSDLDAIAQAWPEQLLVLATRRDAPAVGARVEVRMQDGRTLVARTDADGLAALPVAATDAIARVDLTDGPHRARFAAPGRRPLPAPRAQVTAHLFVDRPLYRAGETVHGRLVVRRADPTGPDAAFVEAPLGAQPVRVRCWPETPNEIATAATTNGRGVAEFELTLPADAAAGYVPVTAELVDPPADLRGDAKPGPLRLSVQRWPFEVRAFRRPPILFDLETPAAGSRDAPFDVVVRARWASGGPCVGVPVEGRVEALGLASDVRATLGPDGTVRVPVAVHELPLPDRPFDVDVQVAVVAPDGQRLEVRSRVPVPGRDDAAPSARTDLTLALDGDAPRAGAAIAVRVEGRPGARVLLGAGRDGCREAKVVTLDRDGRARARFETLKADFPSLRVAATSTTGTDRAAGRWLPMHTRTLDVPLQRAWGALSLAVDAPDRPRPGADVELAVHVARADRPVAGATVAIAVVDESLFALARDRTLAAGPALRPERPAPSVEDAFAPGPVHSYAVIGELLRQGAQPEPVVEESAFESNQWNSAVGLGGGAGGRYGGRGGDRSEPREDFRTTASFVADAPTDADGIARVRFAMPDDLTTWRVTVIAVASDGEAAGTVAHTATALPLAARIVLPRVMRDGDRVDVLGTARREDGPAIDGAIAIRTEGPLAVDGVRERAVRLADGVPAEAHFTLAARSEGEGRVRVDAHAGAMTDAEVRPLPVLPDEAAIPVALARAIEGPTDMVLPRTEDGAPVDVELRLFGNRDAALRDAARWLGEYPYGCAEQTMSRLVPAFVAIAAARARGDAVDPELGLRIEIGMARLRALQVTSADGFRWWHDGEVDRGMTAIVLWALADARASGVAPAAYGIAIECDAPDGAIRDAVDAVSLAEGAIRADGDGAPSLATAELAVAALRWSPGSERARRAVESIVDRAATAPEGLLARAGIALADAGDPERPARVLDRIVAARDLAPAAQPARGGGLWLGEEPATRIAHRLELALRVDRAVPIRAEAAAALLGMQRDGRFGTTWATAQAYRALCRDAAAGPARPADDPITVRVVAADGAPYSVTLSPSNAFTASIGLGDARAAKVDALAGRGVRAVLRGVVRTRGSECAATARPVEVTREIGLRDETAPYVVGVPRLVPLVVRLAVMSPRDVDYAVLSCPLPAGFEVPGRPGGWEIRDDRAVRLLPRLRAGERIDLALPVVAALSGDVAWPPATVEAMYEDAVYGMSGGGRLSVVDAELAPAIAAPALDLAALDRASNQLVGAVERSEDPDGVRRAIADLGALCGERGPRVVLERAEGWLLRFASSDDAVRAIVDAIDELPEADAAARACLAGGPATRVGAAMLAVRSARYRAADGWLGALAALADGVAPFDRLEADLRKTLVVGRVDELVLAPFRETLNAAIGRDGVAHAEGPEVPDVLRAWRPVVLAAARRCATDLTPGDGAVIVSALLRETWAPPSGAIPGPTVAWASALRGSIAQVLADVVLADGGLKWSTPEGCRAAARVAASLPDAGARIRAFRALLRAVPADADPIVAEAVTDAVPADVFDALEADLLESFARLRTAQRGATLWRAVPVRIRRALPPSTIVGLFTGAPLPPLDELPLGQRRAVVLEALARADRPRLSAGDALRILGDDGMARLPLAQIAELEDPAALDALLAAHPATDAELARALVTRRDADWRATLCRALWRRGATAAVEGDDDPAWPFYAMVLDAARGDVTARAAAIAMLEDDDAARNSRERGARDAALPRVLRELAVVALIDDLDVPHLARWAAFVPSRDRAALVARLDRLDARAVADLVARPDWERSAAIAHLIVTRALAAGLASNLTERTAQVADPRHRSTLVDVLAESAAGRGLLAALVVDPARGDAGLRELAARALHRTTGRAALWRGTDGRWRRTADDDAERRLRVEGLTPELLAAALPRVRARLHDRGLGVPDDLPRRVASAPADAIDVRIVVDVFGTAVPVTLDDGTELPGLSGHRVHWLVGPRRVEAPGALRELLTELLRARATAVRVVAGPGTLREDVTAALAAALSAGSRVVAADDADIEPGVELPR